MIIHIWMHWFWITTVSFKGFLFFTIQMISISCIPNPSIAEAGLLDNETFTDHNLSIYEATNSSQVEPITNITSLPIENVQEPTRPPEPTSEVPSPSSPHEETDTESTLKPEEVSRLTSEGASDIEDTYNGGSLDVFQYPLKKFAKYSHTKYGKVKTKGKPSDEPGGEGERKVESLKIVEEKLNINFSVDGDSAGREVEPEVDKGNDTIAAGSTSEVPGETVEVITSAPMIDNSTVDVSNGTEVGNETFVLSTEEILLKDEPPRTDAPVTSSSDFLQNVTEIQKDVVIKNDTLVIENKVEESRSYTTVEPFIVKTRVAAATSQNYEVNQQGLNAGSITGITLGILVVFSLFGAVSFVLYRRRYLNKPQVLHDKCSNLDSSGYIDDTSLRENSEEMYSLDNDSFLNSLEAMTIQNYWTESVKHTKL